MERIKREIEEVILDCTGFDQKLVSRAVLRCRNTNNGDFIVCFSQLTRDASVINDVYRIIQKHPVNIIKKAYILGQLLYIHVETREIAKEILLDILTKKEKYGDSSVGEGETVLVEFSSPNIAKEFHAGHLRTTIIGNYVKNIHKKMGYNTVGINYLGDWGKQFGFLGIGYKKYGDPKEMEADPIRHLHNVYVQICREAEENPEIGEKAKEFFRKMENGDKECLDLWRWFREISVKKYEEAYAKMNIFFDVYSGESFYGDVDVEAIKKKPYVLNDKKDNSYYVEFKNLPKTVLIKSNGSTLYLTRDIDAAKDRMKKYNPCKSIYVVASQQDLHFKQLFRILELEGMDASKFLHVNFGMVQKMSTRKGTVVFLSDIISEVQQVMLEKMKETGKGNNVEDMEKTSHILALSAVYIQDFRGQRNRSYEFDMEQNSSFKGATGPYIQYTLCRVSSIARNSQYQVGDVGELNFAHLKEDKCYELVFLLARYPYVLEDSFKDYEPCTIVNYIFQVCQLLNHVFKIVWVAKEEEEVARARLAMYEAVRYVLADALKILGLIPLERM